MRLIICSSFSETSEYLSVVPSLTPHKSQWYHLQFYLPLIISCDQTPIHSFSSEHNLRDLEKQKLCIISLHILGTFFVYLQINYFCVKEADELFMRKISYIIYEVLYLYFSIKFISLIFFFYGVDAQTSNNTYLCED